MKSLLLSAVLGLATLGLFVGTAGEAQAQRRGRDGDSDRRGYSGRPGYYGYNRGYSGSRYYGGYYSRPSTYQSYYYGPGDADRYSYYWSNGWYICYDRVTGDYWYQGSSGSWYRWY
jgi:hypothetical protein